jgi:cell division septation protein DedD
MSELLDLRMSRKRAYLLLACMAGACVLLFFAGVAAGLLWAGFSNPAQSAQAVPLAPVKAAPASDASSAGSAASAGSGEAPKENLSGATHQTDSGGAATMLASVPTLAALPPPAPAAKTTDASAKPAAQTEELEKGTAEAVPAMALAIRVCSFTGQNSAQMMVDDLTGRGYHATVAHATGSGKRDWYIVKVGPYSAWNAASNAAAQIAIAEKVRPLVEPVK